jgi:hypothetical protein
MSIYHQLDPDLVKDIEWTGDVKHYDSALSSIGPVDQAFVVINPWLEDTRPFYYIEDVELDDRCITYMYKGQWVAKFFPPGWSYEQGYDTREIEMPRSIWRKNPDLDRTMTFEDDPFNTYMPDPYEAKCELVWYIDSRFNPLEDKVWAMTCRPMGGDVIERREMGYLTPDVDIEINPDLPDLKIDIDNMMPAFWELSNTTVWTLDPAWTYPEDIWVVQIKPGYRKPGEWTVKGYIEPKFKTIYNPDLPRLDYELELDMTWHDLIYCHVWYLDRSYTKELDKPIWAFKITAGQGLKEKSKGSIKPTCTIEYNPDLPDLTYDIRTDTQYYDLGYESVYMLDPKHTQDLDKEIWACKIRYTDKPMGTKTLGYVSPKFRLIRNVSLPKLNFDLPLDIPYYDFAYEHVYYLDTVHTKGFVDKDIWAVKARAVKKPQGTKNKGYVKPLVTVEYHNETADMDFEIANLCIPYYDLVYNNVYYLDPEYIRSVEHYAFILKYTDKPIGSKKLGYIKPRTHIQINKAIKNLKVDFDYQIPYYDRNYLHEWYMTFLGETETKIWAVRAWLQKDVEIIKDMGYLDVEYPNHLDVIFISYDEADAEKNWNRVLEKAPWAKRVHGVEGILEAHRAAAELATTDMFYVVDGDAYLTVDFQFTFQPDLFDRDCVYVYKSLNEVTGDSYGYGGVKIFPREKLLKLKKWVGLDLTTSFSKVKILDDISCFTRFAYDDISAYRSGFREAVKLCWNRHNDPDNPIHLQRLEQWKTRGLSKAHGEMSITGAWDGEGYFYFYKEKYQDQLTWQILEKINSREYLNTRFKKRFNKD